MTLLLSLMHPEALIMAADSRKTTIATTVHQETFEPIGEPIIEYSDTTKLFLVPGVACVSMWGDITRSEQRIGTFLRSIRGQVDEPEDVAQKLVYFLKEKIHADDGTDVGFHVGGFRKNGDRSLFHVFWGVERGPAVDPNNNAPDFKKHDHSSHAALYNGQNGIADGVFQFLRALELEVGIVTWITNHSLAKAVRFSDFILRYAAAIDPTVGGTVSNAIIFPGNRVKVIQNSTSQPIPLESLESFLR